MALRSIPEQNVPPAPVRMAQRMSSLVSISTHASAIPTSIGRLRAFLAAGRFIVTTAVAPRRSNVRCSVETDASASPWSEGLTGCRSEPLDDGPGGQRPAAAHGDQTVGGVAALELVEDRRDQAAAGRPDRVAEGDGPAVHVDLFHVGLDDLGPDDH